MHIQRPATYDEVKANFLENNATTQERNEWPLGALEIANGQFGTWTYVLLDPAELLPVLLPHHNHAVNLVPVAGSTVLATVAKVAGLDPSSECHKRIQQFFGALTPAIFLSAAPINHPRYADYHGLIHRGCTGLTHLDGLHRLLAWGLENKRRVPAYVAGLT
jgi:hypothetical protein